MFLVMMAASYLTDDTSPRPARGSLLGRLVCLLTLLKNVFRAAIPSSLFPPDGGVCGAEGRTVECVLLCLALSVRRNVLTQHRGAGEAVHLRVSPQAAGAGSGQRGVRGAARGSVAEAQSQQLLPADVPVSAVPRVFICQEESLLLWRRHRWLYLTGCFSRSGWT